LDLRFGRRRLRDRKDRPIVIVRIVRRRRRFFRRGLLALGVGHERRHEIFVVIEIVVVAALLGRRNQAIVLLRGGIRQRGRHLRRSGGGRGRGIGVRDENHSVVVIVLSRRDDERRLALGAFLRGSGEFRPDIHLGLTFLTDDANRGGRHVPDLLDGGNGAT